MLSRGKLNDIKQLFCCGATDCFFLKSSDSNRVHTKLIRQAEHAREPNETLIQKEMEHLSHFYPLQAIWEGCHNPNVGYE